LSTLTQLPANYLEYLNEFEKLTLGQDLPGWQQLRREAFARFCEIGFPTTHNEDWRFTDVSAISKTQIRRIENSGSLLSPHQIQQWRPASAACQLVFVNGQFAANLSDLTNIPEGVTVAGLANQLVRSPELDEHHLGRYADWKRDGFSALNVALAEDGAFINIPRNVVVTNPISVLFVSTPDMPAVMSHPRNLIIVGEGAQVSVVEEYVSIGSGAALCNTVTELVVGDNAMVSHLRIEHEQASTFNISTLSIHQGRSANVESHSVLLGGALVRNNVHPVLAGEGGECLINGLFLGEDHEHLDNYMLVEHASPHCSSRQFYNGILDDQAHGVFHGRIIVHKGAQKTDAKQTNRNLLLSDDARIDTKPQLEIHADDVKCTHGATIGQIDEVALFYLRSRGIEEVSARSLLLLAFAGECIERMKDGPVRKYVEALVSEHVMHLANSVRTKSVGNDVVSDYGTLA